MLGPDWLIGLLTEQYKIEAGIVNKAGILHLVGSLQVAKQQRTPNVPTGLCFQFAGWRA